jgi:hypothetical protein
MVYMVSMQYWLSFSMDALLYGPVPVMSRTLRHGHKSDSAYRSPLGMAALGQGLWVLVVGMHLIAHPNNFCTLCLIANYLGSVMFINLDYGAMRLLLCPVTIEFFLCLIVVCTRPALGIEEYEISC